MELLEFKNRIFDLFEIDSVSSLGDKLMDAVLKHDVKIFQGFESLVKDETKDWLQALWQYYEADRTEKKQDYTPKSLCKMVSRLIGNQKGTIYDCCGGSGALTIEAISNSQVSQYCIEELDENVIPFLLFNLCLRNSGGIVKNCDVLSKEIYNVYRITPSVQYSECKVISKEEIANNEFDVAISNPPYNIKWNPPTEIDALIDSRFPIVPPANNGNYAFVLNCLDRANKSILILPNGVLSESTEQDIRQYLIENDYIETIISMPEKMFECTTIATCIMVLNKSKDELSKGRITFVDSRQNHETEERLQNGQFGSASHTNRTYKKAFNVLSDENIQRILDSIQNKQNDPEFSITVSNDEIIQNESLLIPSQYIEFDSKESQHRDFQEIADNINYITKMKNSCKLVINETIAKSVGIDVELFTKNKKESQELKETYKSIGIDIESEDFIQFTKNKNEFVFKCNDKEILPDMLLQFLTVWKNQIALLNTMQTAYLKELRDSLLPDLMSGKVNVDNVNIDE